MPRPPTASAAAAQRVSVAFPDRDRRTERGQSLGDAPADAGAPAGDHRDAAGEQDVGRVDGHSARLARPGAVPMTPSASSRPISSSVSPSSVQHLVVVLAEQRRGRAVHPLGPRENRNGRVLCGVRG